MNLSQLQAEIGRLLSDPNNDRWSTSVLNTRINVAQDIIQGQTNAVKQNEVLTPAASVGLNASTIDVIRVTIFKSDATTVEVLPGTSLFDLDYRYPNWKNWTQGEPITYYFSSNASGPLLNLVPTPDAANIITNGMTVTESRLPADISDASSLPFDSYQGMIPYHMSIVHWVVAQCWMDNADPESLAKSIFHKSGSMEHPGQYELQIKRIQSQFEVIEDIPSAVLWRPEGGRTGSWSPSKAYPLR